MAAEIALLVGDVVQRAVASMRPRRMAAEIVPSRSAILIHTGLQ